jgi:hypothetical protein
MSDRRIPRALTIVGWIFILQGVWALFDIAGAALQGQSKLSIGVLGLLIGPGLLRLDPRWRRRAVVVMQIAIVVASALLVIVLFAPEVPMFEVRMFGEVIGRGS